MSSRSLSYVANNGRGFRNDIHRYIDNFVISIHKGGGRQWKRNPKMIRIHDRIKDKQRFNKNKNFFIRFHKNYPR